MNICILRTAACAACIALLSARAHADPATAEALFRQGRQLMAEGKIAAACEKFQASQRIDPSSGTLLNLADCDVKEGRSATAWAEFLSAARMARNQGDTGRAEEATRRARELEPALSHVTIKVTLRVPALRVTRDDVAVEEASLSSDLPIDPGQHVISASAPGYKSWSKTIRVGGSGDKQEVVIPALVKDASAPVTTLSASSSNAGSAAGSDAASAAPLPRSPMLGYVVGGAGLAAAGIGGFFGLRALSTYKEAERDCPSHAHCSATVTAKYDTATTEANISNVTIGVGVAAIAVGAYLVLTASSPPEPSRSAKAMSFSPWLGPAAGGGVLSGHF
jgi:hypothetical protein